MSVSDVGDDSVVTIFENIDAAAEPIALSALSGNASVSAK